MDNQQDEMMNLQTKMAYMESDMAEMNQVLLTQQKQIDQQETLLKKLQDKLAHLEEQMEDQGSGNSMPHEKPPHY